MPKQVRFKGQIHSFPDNFTDEQIAEALASVAAEAPALSAEPAKPGLLSDPLGYGKELVSNIPGSALDAVVDTVKGIPAAVATGAHTLWEANPISTIPKALNTPHGIPTSLREVKENLQSAMPTGLSVLRGIVQHYADRYGSPSKAAETLRDDPAGAVADVLPIGKPLQMAGAAGKAPVVARITKATKAVEEAQAAAKAAGLNRPATQARTLAARKELEAAIQDSKRFVPRVASGVEATGKFLDAPVRGVVAPIVSKVAPGIAKQVSRFSVGEAGSVRGGGLRSAARSYYRGALKENISTNVDRIVRARDLEHALEHALERGRRTVAVDTVQLSRLQKFIANHPNKAKADTRHLVAEFMDHEFGPESRVRGTSPEYTGIKHDVTPKEPVIADRISKAKRRLNKLQEAALAEGPRGVYGDAIDYVVASKLGDTATMKRLEESHVDPAGFDRAVKSVMNKSRGNTPELRDLVNAATEVSNLQHLGRSLTGPRQGTNLNIPAGTSTAVGAGAYLFGLPWVWPALATVAGTVAARSPQGRRVISKGLDKAGRIKAPIINNAKRALVIARLVEMGLSREEAKAKVNEMEKQPAFRGIVRSRR